MKPTTLLALLALAAAACRDEAKTATANGRVDTAASASAAPTYGIEVVRRWPHDPSAFTEGLEFVGPLLYEGTGGDRSMNRQSSVRIVDPATGAVKKKVDLSTDLFGEGITVLDGKLYELTWKTEKGFVYDAATLRQTGTFGYKGEGWGMTNNGRALVMSNGTDVIQWMDPRTFQVTKRLKVTDQGLPVTQLNELELIKGELWANVWQTTTIARIDTTTGHVTSWLDVGDLLTNADRSEPVDVLNGIAYDRANDRIFLTGKDWPAMFEVKVKQ